MLRTIENGHLTKELVNQEVELVGWVSKKRNFGQKAFIDLRDRTGICQLVFEQDVRQIRSEYILHVKGKVVLRQQANPDLPTGEVEILVSWYEVVNEAQTTPLLIADETDALEDTRLIYRYLDLRRPVMQKRLMMRHQIGRSIRRFLDDEQFIEIETPMLGRSTPEGARDYLVPSRVHPGQFYALPQSPQLYKQLLMISGFERYYQFARCFRDEDLRADRQTDFTQVDIETSFLTEDEIMSMMEALLKQMMKEVKGMDIQTPFLRLSYHDAMNRYGSDKPDNRFGYELQEVTDLFEDSDFKVFNQAESIKLLHVDQMKDLTRKQIDQYTELVKKNGAQGLVVLKVVENQLQGSAAKFISESQKQSLFERFQPQDGDAFMIVASSWSKTCQALGALRNQIGQERGLKPKDTFSFLWVVDFPMFEYSETEGRYVSSHHPFTQPKQEDIAYLDSDLSKVRANAYDIILNGYELGGGSLRIHDNQLQAKIFKCLGLSAEDTKEKFGFFIDAFQYGTPPHGGLAFGFDRIAMILSESDSIRDVIAFPKNAKATCMMSQAPNVVDKSQLDELAIDLKVGDE